MGELLREKLLAATSWSETERLRKKIEALILKEKKNVEATIPLVRKDSSLGYEPSMDYTCDEEALLWKLKQLQYVLELELPAFEQ